jgi:hypothetical protein
MTVVSMVLGFAGDSECFKFPTDFPLGVTFSNTPVALFFSGSSLGASGKFHSGEGPGDCDGECAECCEEDAEGCWPGETF